MWSTFWRGLLMYQSLEAPDHSAKLLSWAAGAGRKRVPQDPAALCAGTSDGKGKTAAFGNSWKKLGVYGRTVPGRMVF